MAEESIYADETVTVTTARVMISGTTYALRNITSVKMTVTPANQQSASVLLVFGILGVIGSLAAFGQNAGAGLTWLFIGGGIVAIAVFWIRSLKPTYNVTIASSAGEIRALTSLDEDYIAKIVAAINEAFVRYR